MKVLVKNTEVQKDITKKGTAIYRQRCALDTGDGYPLPFFVTLQNPESAYPIGDYLLAPECFQTSQYGSLEINRYNIRLVPLKVNKAA